MSLGAYLTWNNFWTKFFLRNDFSGLKDTIKLYILAKHEKHLLSSFQENSKYLMFDYFSMILQK